MTEPLGAACLTVPRSGLADPATVGGASMAVGVPAAFGIVSGLHVGITGRSPCALFKGGRQLGVVMLSGALTLLVSSVSVYGEQPS